MMRAGWLALLLAAIGLGMSTTAAASDQVRLHVSVDVGGYHGASHRYRGHHWKRYDRGNRHYYSDYRRGNPHLNRHYQSRYPHFRDRYYDRNSYTSVTRYCTNPHHRH